LRTACTRDCPDACGILATVDESGRVLALAGDPAHPVTRGFLCARTSRYLRRQYDRERLVQPLVRRAGRLEPASWDAALDLVAAELERIRTESGPEAVLHYRSGGSLGILKTVNDWFFECFGGARVKHGDICSGAGAAAQEADLGISESHDSEDLLASRIILLWGKNVTTSFVHLLPVLKAARARGARIVLIDPVPHGTRRFADEYLQPRPGTDRFLALGMARVLYESGLVDPSIARWSVGHDEFRALAFTRSVEEWARAADVPAGRLAQFATDYGTLRPGNIQVGWGLQRRGHGGATVRVLDALGALTGNFGVQGGGVSFTYRRRGAFDVARYGPPDSRRGIPEPLLGRGILAAQDPPVRAVVVDNGNPVAMLPESHTVASALASREFVVVLEQFLTDTASLAHVVLPVTTMLEEADLVGAYGHHFLTATNPVASRSDGVRSDLEIYQALAARLGFGAALSGTPAEWSARLLAPITDQVNLDDLRAGAVRNPLAKRVLFEGQRFETPDERFHFITQVDLSEEPEDAEYPLQLGSFSTPGAQSSQWSISLGDAPLTARCHPAAAVGIPDGAPARVASRAGTLAVTLRHDPALRADLLLIPKGGWLQHGRAANALVRARATDMGLGAAYYDERVRIEPL
jgi:anaerobic selenocysteine-containing dehydrogenase